MGSLCPLWGLWGKSIQFCSILAYTTSGRTGYWAYAPLWSLWAHGPLWMILERGRGQSPVRKVSNKKAFCISDRQER